MTHGKMHERINIGAGMVPTYHATESVDEARAVVESCWPATHKLRHLLSERGVEYETCDDVPFYIPATFWVDYNGDRCSALECVEATNGGGTLDVCTVMTPEQAIAATLGAGTCCAIISDNLTESEGMGDAWADCSECGHLLFVLTDPNSEPPNFCPNCGRRVIHE